MALIDLVAEDLLDGSLNFFIVDGTVGHHLQSLSLVLGKAALPQDQMAKQAPSRIGGKKVQPLLLQLCECCLLCCQETGHGLTSLSAAFEDRVVEGRLQALVSEVFVSISMMPTMVL